MKCFKSAAISSLRDTLYNALIQYHQILPINNLESRSDTIVGAREHTKIFDQLKFIIQLSTARLSTSIVITKLKSTKFKIRKAIKKNKSIREKST